MPAHLFYPDDLHDSRYLVYVARCELLAILVERPQDQPPRISPCLDIDGKEALEIFAILVQQLVKAKLPLDDDVLEDDGLLEGIDPSDEACRQLAIS